jgi:hypothetical protein
MKPIFVGYLMKGILEVLFFFGKTKEIRIPEASEKILSSPEQNFIIITWHNLSTLLVHFQKYLIRVRGRKVTGLISKSKDGDFISETLRHFDIPTVRGSSSKGGVEGLKGIIRTIKEGWDPVFAVDGPRGPIYGVKPGAIVAASLTGRPLIYIYVAYSKFWQFRSWDLHKLPKPGCKRIYFYSEPIFIPKKLSEEDIQSQVQRIQELMVSKMKEWDQTWDNPPSNS